MKKRLTLAFAAGALVAAMLPGTASAGVETLATGSGHITYLGEYRTFSFTARELSDGRVKGHAQNDNPALPIAVEYSVACLDVQGNVAYVGVTVVESTNTAFAPIGSGWAFKVIDNGEGDGDPPDRITTIWAGGSDCVARQGFLNGAPLWDVEGGNIQVH